MLTLRIGSWDLLEGVYRDWVGVGGNVTVQSDGTIMVAFAGSVLAAGQSPEVIAEEISAALRAATGEEAPPAVVVELAERRPVYVSGDVTSPGAIAFLEGLTVRQALALAGGPLRFLPGSDPGLLAEQAQLREAILRADLRIARLEAELAGADDFDLPSGVEGSAGLDSLVVVERRLMQSREAALTAQTASVDELIAVLISVRGGLEEQIDLVEAEIERAEEDLSRRRDLLARGLSRETDVANAETSVSNLRLRLVDMNTQYLNVEKDLSEAERGRDTLAQTREIEILEELSAARDRRRDLEVQAIAFVPGLVATESAVPVSRVLLIEAGRSTPYPVEPETRLRPGDTLILETGVQ